MTAELQLELIQDNLNTKAKPLTAEQERILILNVRAITENAIESISDEIDVHDDLAIERLKSSGASMFRAEYERCESFDEFINFCATINLFRLLAEDQLKTTNSYIGTSIRIAELLIIATTRASQKTKAEVIDLLTGSSHLISSLTDVGGKLARVQTAREAAKAAHATNAKLAAKQAAKAGVREWWERWQSEPSMYKSKAAFARIMCDKYPDELESTQVIERWCTEWQRNRSPE